MKKVSIIAIALGIFSCQPKTNTSMNDHPYTNALIHSTSPYLLQHAHNPVNWEEWSPEVLERAKKEDKLIIVSIGYSSCHWCHVMEKESFEDTAVARIMNENFISIKVDREERPDVDQIYMSAVQSMNQQGGWPLNVFLTPDQKPFYGGTYFPKEGWKRLLNNIATAFEEKREDFETVADQVTESLKQKEKEKYKLEGTDHRLSEEDIAQAYQNLAIKFDKTDGGIRKSPKFPMPAVWQFLANYYHHTKNEEALDHLSFTLEKIADGGIYDHIGGGFARYSTDEEWHVPHFEKMLYDNGQLLSLYANGFKLTKNPKFKQVILETTGWMKREMLDETGGFYAALDADSEGEEGKFYVWSEEEIREIAGNDFEIVADYYDVQPDGNWEDTNVLRVTTDKAKVAGTHSIGIDELDKKISIFKSKALKEREKRERPGLDSKIIAGWNGLALSGLSEAYQATADPLLLDLATKNAEFIRTALIKGGRLHRFPDKEMEGFLEDYAAVIQAFIKYYETTFEWEYLEAARVLIKRTDEAFYDEAEHLYFFTSEGSETLIARKKELFDNVIPASNSIMAWNLVHLGTHFYDEALISKGESILAQVTGLIKEEPEYLSYWGALALELSGSFAEVVIVGEEFEAFGKDMNEQFLPNKILTAAPGTKESPLFEYKEAIGGLTTVYVCYDRSCKRPVNSVEAALGQLD